MVIKTYYAYSSSPEGPYQGLYSSLREVREDALVQAWRNSKEELPKKEPIFIRKYETIYPDIDVHDLLENIRHKMDLDRGSVDSSYLMELTEDEKAMLSSLVRDALKRWADLVGEYATVQAVSGPSKYSI